MTLRNALGAIALDSTVASLGVQLEQLHADLATQATAEGQTALGGKLDIIAGRLPALESGRTPVALPAATVTALTPPAAITGFATAAKQDEQEATLNSIESRTPTLESGRVPVALPTATVTALTPPAAITGYATETTLESLRAQSNTGIRGIRRDTDDTPAADGGSHTLYTNQVGRLKSSSWPGAYAVVTGSITANGQTVVADVTRASNLTVYCTGTFAGINVTFEASLDGTNWFAITGARTNSNTAELTTGALSAAPAYAWELSVNGYTSFRVRATAFTSGSQTWTMVRGAYATEPAPVIQTHAVTGSGTFTVAGTTTATPATPTPHQAESTAAAVATSVKTSAGTIYGISASNPTATAAYLKLYNKASAPAPASDTPFRTIPVPANSDVFVNFGEMGHRCATGIAYGITGAIGKTDTTATAAGIQVAADYI